MSKRIVAVIVGMALALGAVACGGGSPSDIGKGPMETTQIGGTASPLPPTSQPTVDVPVPTKTKAISAEQRNAIRTAQDYLDGGNGFSRKGLIDQLKFEGYSTKVSTAAVDSLHADWNAQAALTAKSYLDGQGFSKKALTSQLEFEGYTHAQAVYGVKAAGL
jgi:hypothetical protein